MEKNNLDNLLSKIDAALAKKGISFSEIDKFKKNLIKETQDKEKFLMDEIYKSAQKKSEIFLSKKVEEIEKLSLIHQDKIIEALKTVKFEPQLVIDVSNIKIPEIKIPEIKIPNMPQIKIPDIKIPEIKIPEIKMPDNMKVDGLKEFIKELLTYLKNERLSNIDRDNPLPVILTDEKGSLYRASMAITGGYVGGGGGNSGEMLGETAGTLKQRIAYIGTTSNPEYIGEALSDVLTTENKWRIKKLTYDINYNLLAINWCYSETGFKYSWDNRASYSYI